MIKNDIIKRAFFAAFPHTIPILAGFLFLGIAYGIYMNALGFSAVYPIIMSITVFTGSAEFAAAGLLLGAFAPVKALLITLIINVRHIFYGISMLDKYKNTGRKKIYLIYGMCDESFSINYTADLPPGVDKGWFMFFVTLLNHIYWVAGASIGGLAGSLIAFNTKGIEFVMTALFVVIFLEQWLKDKKHYSSILGLALSIICLALFGGSSFIIPSMIAIFAFIVLLRGTIERSSAPQ